MRASSVENYQQVEVDALLKIWPPLHKAYSLAGETKFKYVKS